MSTILPDLPASTETGRLGVGHLKRFWAKQLARRAGQLKGDAYPDEWPLDQGVLNALGLPLEPTITYLYQAAPAFAEFEAWVEGQQPAGALPAAEIARFNAGLGAEAPAPDPRPAAPTAPVLTAADHAFFAEHGYLVLRQAVPPAQVAAAAQAVWDFLGRDPARPASWYAPHPATKGIMVQLFHHPALETNRRAARIRQAFAELYGHDELFVTTDRVSFNPPQTAAWSFPGPRLHWDAHLHQRPLPLGLQGLLYLSDTPAHQGAFRLVPGFQHRLEPWLAALPPGADPQLQDLEALGPQPIGAQAGDFILWHHALPHGASANTGTFPRLVQYINWRPTTEATNL